jgi:CubicO group peptidase (beta-lactamase class C family)
MDKLLSLCKISLCSIFLFAYTIISLPLIAGQAVVAGEHKQINEFTDFLDRRIPALMESYAIPGVAIALIDQGEIAWVKAYGHADLEEKRLMTTDTICRVQSISKSLTAWGIMKLVEDGVIDLDSPALDYLGAWEFPPSGYHTDAITVRQLLSLSAGMPLGDVLAMYSPTEARPSLEDALFKDAVAINEPGAAFNYSNVSINLLELIIEKVTGRDFAEYMAEEILIPLGMSQSSFNWRSDFSPPVPVGYDLSGNPKPVYVYPEKASGGLFASVEDIAKFVAAGMTGKYTKKHGVLKDDTIDLLYQPEVNLSGFYALAFNAYGLGHLIEYLPGGTLAVSHGGQGSGVMSHYHSIPEEGSGIVILTNSQRSWPFFAYILTDWAKWLGYPSIGFGRIILGKNILTAIVVLIVLLSIYKLWVLGKALKTGKASFNPFSGGKRLARAIQGFFAAALFSLIIWAVNQVYLNITSLFPIVSVWLGYSILLAALTLLLSAIIVDVDSST